MPTFQLLLENIRIVPPHDLGEVLCLIEINKIDGGPRF
jgi:hypothetical protein